jgi:hypothetical protein
MLTTSESTVDIKVDKVEGERLINASEITKLGISQKNKTQATKFAGVLMLDTYATITAM